MSTEPVEIALPDPSETSPWAMLGYLSAELSLTGRITPEAWATAIEKSSR